MNTKRLASVALIIGLMATNTVSVFADTTTGGTGTGTDTTVTTGNSSTTDTAKTAKDAEKAKRAADKAAAKAAKDAEKAKRKADKAAKAAVDLVCMQTAVAAREASVVSSFDTYFADYKTALSTRMDALKAAWALTDATARKDAIKKAWSDFNTAFKTDRSTLSTARKAAWDKFKTDAQACHAAKSETNDTDNDKSI